MFILFLMLLIVVVIILTIFNFTKNNQNIFINHFPHESFVLTNFQKEEFHNFNPSIFFIKDQLYKVYRVSNTSCPYYKKKKLSSVRNKIFIEYPNKNIIEIDYPRQKRYKNCAEAFEDPRSIIFNQQLLLLCNNPDEKNCKNKMYILFIDINKEFINASDKSFLKPVKILPLHYSTFSRKIQKNWTPFVSDNKLYFIYKINPQIIIDCNLITGHCTKISELFHKRIPKNLRGGTPAILIDNQYYISIAHTKSFDIQHNFIYYTYFYKFNKHYPFSITNISKPYLIENPQDKKIFHPIIQFASGIEQDYDDHIYIAYGMNDCYSKMLMIHKNVLSLLF